MQHVLYTFDRLIKFNHILHPLQWHFCKQWITYVLERLTLNMYDSAPHENNINKIIKFGTLKIQGSANILRKNNKKWEITDTINQKQWV